MQIKQIIECSVLLGVITALNIFLFRRCEPEQTTSYGEIPVEYIQSDNCNLPVLVVNTSVPRAFISKSYRIEGALSLFDSDRNCLMTGKSGIKGRGHSSWHFPKKSYNIKLKSAVELLGMPASKDWCLLANWMDRTLIRNAVGFEIARKTNLDWTPQGRFVELVFNGKHLGNYYLCEKITAGGHRLPGQVFEMDCYYDEKFKFMSHIRNLPWMFKYPKEVDEHTFFEFESFVNEMESSLYDSVRFSKREYTQYLDAESMADWWIVCELSMNSEYTTPKSVWFHRKQGDVLRAGPVWDFDWRTFTPDYSNKPIQSRHFYFDRLFQDEAFVSTVRERWQILKPTFESDIPVFIDSLRVYLEKSEKRNQSLWPLDRQVNGDELLDYPDAVRRLNSLYLDKLHWLDGYLAY